MGGGACDNFTELNYGPEVAAVADFTVHSVNPQVHAFDEASIVETLAMHGLGVDNARQLSGGKAVVVSPVMFTRRWRTNDTGAPAGPANVLPFQSDPRLDRQCVAAWTLGSIAQLARHGAASATYFETGGENGLVGRDGRARPITDALALVRDFTGCPVHASASSHPWYVEALAVRLEGRLVVVLANLRGETVRVRLTSGPAVRSLELPPYALLRVEPA